MKALQLDTTFPTLGVDISPQRAAIAKTGSLPDGDNPLEVKMWYVLYLIKHKRPAEAGFLVDALNFEPRADMPLICSAWLWLARMSICIAKKDYLMATDAAEHSLLALDELPTKKGEDFLSILAALLYNLAVVHNDTDDNGRAAKELSKAQKLYERLAKKDDKRYATMLTYAIEASTTIFKSRQQQMTAFARLQEMTEQYGALADKGNHEAMTSLVDTLHKEGDIMLSMGNGRDAVKYFTKALRYQKRISDKIGRKELRLSIGLSKALMRVANRRDTAEQLLTSLQPLATRLGANEEAKEIAELLEKKTKNSAIMSLLKGVF